MMILPITIFLVPLMSDKLGIFDALLVDDLHGLLMSLSSAACQDKD